MRDWTGVSILPQKQASGRGRSYKLALLLPGDKGAQDVPLFIVHDACPSEEMYTLRCVGTMMPPSQNEPFQKAGFSNFL